MGDFYHSISGEPAHPSPLRRSSTCRRNRSPGRSLSPARHRSLSPAHINSSNISHTPYNHIGHAPSSHIGHGSSSPSHMGHGSSSPSHIGHGSSSPSHISHSSSPTHHSSSPTHHSSNSPSKGSRSASPARRGGFRSGRKLPSIPNKKLDLALNKFTNIALPFHLEVIAQHRTNIEKFQTVGDWDSVRKEVDAASRAVRQLGSLLFEMEVLRSYLEQQDLAYFDQRVEPAKKQALLAIKHLQEICPGNPGNFSSIQNGARRSASLTGGPKTPESPLDIPMARRHSDSETQSCNSLPYSLGADSRDSLVEDQEGQRQRTAKEQRNVAEHRLRRTQSQEDTEHRLRRTQSQDSRFRSHQAKEISQMGPNRSMSLKTVYKGHPGSNQDPPSSPRTRRRNLGFPAPGEVNYAEVRYHSSGEVVRYHAPNPAFHAPNSAFHAPNPSSPSPGSCGTLGPGTLEILYEDPKEDQVSLLSGEEDSDKRRLLSPRTDKMEDSHWDQHEEETWQSWQNLQEEIRDINTLIVEFSNMVVDSGDAMNAFENAKNRYREHSGNIPSSAIYPVAGALLGTCLGGPVGFLAGVKIGGLAAIGGSLFGYSTGSLIKEHKDRQEYIDDFYAAHPEAYKIWKHELPQGKLDEHKRAASLPDVLDEAAEGDKRGSRKLRKTQSWRRPRKHKSSDNLL